MSKKERWMFLKKTAILLDASLSMSEALHISAKNIRNKKMKVEIASLVGGVTSGQSLSKIMSTHQDAWGRSTIAMVAVGELSGTLSSTLKRAAEVIRLRSLRVSQLVSAFLYPAVVACLAFSMIIFLLAVIYPKIIPLFESMKAELPLSTRLVMMLSQVVSRYWLRCISALVLVTMVCVYTIRKYPYARRYAEHAVLNIPFAGRLILIHEMSELAYMIGSLMDGGMTVSEGVAFASTSTNLHVLQIRLITIGRRISYGENISSTVMSSAGFPPLWQDMLVVGERTGSLAQSFITISDIHRQEMDDIIAISTKMIEPVLMIVVGVLVGFIALSIVTPMYSLTQYVHG